MAELAFRQSLVRYLVLLVLPGVLTASWLVRLSMWGFRVFPPRDETSRLLYAYGPLILAAAIVIAILSLALGQGHVEYRLTPFALHRRVGGRTVEVWPLDRLYIVRQQGALFPVAHVTDGKRFFRVHGLFLPGFLRFCTLLEGVSRARRRVESL